MKKLFYLSTVNLALAVVFTLLCIPVRFDISVLAFPLAAVFTFFISYITLKDVFKNNDAGKIDVIRRLFQYEPFVYLSAFVLRRSGAKGCNYVLDLITVIIWVAILVLSFIILHQLSEKRVYALSDEWTKYHKEHPAKKTHGLKRVGIEILEWVDALVWAVFVIILVNIFVIQLYEIPSESMVPTFLIKDRVVVVKTFAGPKFPLSDVGLPDLENYKRGDIVVFRNPHYKDDHKNEVKTCLSQFAYMITLTLVKTNVDENGSLKADPLVKRITGVPGEQLMLMDGNLYSRTKDSDEFKLVAEDNSWAAWNLNGLSSGLKSRIKYLPRTTKDDANTLLVEKNRRELNLSDAAEECKKISAEFSKYCTGKDIDEKELNSMFSSSDLFEFNFFNKSTENTVKLLTSDGGRQWFNNFMNDWYKDIDLSLLVEDGSITGENLVGGDLYSDSVFRLNVMSKLIAGHIILRNAQMISEKINASEWGNDTERNNYFNQAQIINDYLLHMDQRNMPMFPSCDDEGNARYIPENCYFMMGDNRYNSLDMRHSYEQTLTKLTSFDEYSLYYPTNLAPQYVSKSKILGKASFRFWPMDRVGVPKPVRTQK